MSFKILLLLLVGFAVNLFYVNAQWAGKKCIPMKHYDDGCNNCFCAGNRQNEDGVWVPTIGCTMMACLNPDGSVKEPKDPPAEFWEE